MTRTIRGLAVAGLVAVALAAWMAYAHVGDGGAQGGTVSYLPPFTFTTGNLLSSAAGVLTVALTVPRRQRPWTAALLASLVLNAYWFDAFYAALRLFNPSDGVLLPSSLSVVAIDVISAGIAPAAPALLALGYTVRAVRLAPQVTPADEEQGGLDITIESMGSKTR